MITMDTSGTGLHKRGYRKARSSRPSRETLAAGIIDIAHVSIQTPSCMTRSAGSGTLLIEGAMHAMRIAQDCAAASRLKNGTGCPPRSGSRERQRAFDLIRRDSTFRAWGKRHRPAGSGACAASTQKQAGVDARIQVVQRDVRDFSIPVEKGVKHLQPTVRRTSARF